MNKQENKKVNRGIAIFFMVFTSIMIIIFTSQLIEMYFFRQNAVLVEGKVIGHKANKKNEKKWHLSTYAPIVMYKIGDMMMSIHSEVYGSKYDVGEKVDVYYNPKNTEEVRLISFKEVYMPAYIGIGSSFIFFAFGFF